VSGVPGVDRPVQITIGGKSDENVLHLRPRRDRQIVRNG
jgi:hypothetical protein